jgi:hypothetical protein
MMLFRLILISLKILLANNISLYQSKIETQPNGVTCVFFELGQTIMEPGSSSLSGKFVMKIFQALLCHENLSSNFVMKTCQALFQEN